jgi:hypothetical protein
MVHCGSIETGGGVNVLSGAGRRLAAEGNQLWHQDSPGIVEATNPGDLFGSLPGSLGFLSF